jgi:hypothetical protein
MTGIITENACRRRLMRISEGLDDDSCNRTVSVLLIDRFLVILMTKFIGDIYAVSCVGFLV